MEVVMKLMEEENWKTFLERNCHDDFQITRTPLYNLIREKFAVPLMHKLISTAMNDGSPTATRNRSATLLKDMIVRFDHLDTAYATIDVGFFRESALDLMAQHPDEAGSHLHAAGKELAKKLARLSIERKDSWYEFCTHVESSFRDGDPVVVHSCISIISEVEHDYFGYEYDVDGDGSNGDRGNLRRGFAGFVVGVMRRNATDFHKLMVNYLLGDDVSKNYVAFQILPLFHNILNRFELMEAAIMSPFFDHYPFSEKSLAAAIYLRVYLESSRDFYLNPPMMKRLSDIVLQLFMEASARATREAKKLTVLTMQARLRSMPLFV